MSRVKNEVKIMRRCRICGKKFTVKVRYGDEGLISGSGITVHENNIIVPFNYICISCFDADILREEMQVQELNNDKIETG